MSSLANNLHSNSEKQGIFRLDTLQLFLSISIMLRTPRINFQCQSKFWNWSEIGLKYIILVLTYDLRGHLGVGNALIQYLWKHTISDNSRGQSGVQIQCLGPPDAPLRAFTVRASFYLHDSMSHAVAVFVASLKGFGCLRNLGWPTRTNFFIWHC